MSLLSAQGDSEVMAEINITPFTDVLLVLLIIFMILAALSAPPGFEKQLGKSSNAPTTQNQQHQNIQIMVNSKGVIFVDGQKANAQTVYSVLAADIRKRGKKHIALIADAKAPYGIIIRILDAARAAGTDDVGFVTS
ncbi:MAG TPA: biopolymer transporter ExbD [Candidatus Dormibacteraeota bacterium]|nr:biopolymer transporter ExbD [Candidatus Dormibacteraeota bacterium]